MMRMSRIDRVLQAMRERGLKQMIVSDPQSIWYLTGVDAGIRPQLQSLAGPFHRTE